MKTFKSVRPVTFLCIFSLFISMCSFFAVAVGNSAYGDIDNDRAPNAPTDVTIMSFNLMADSDSVFLDTAARLDAADLITAKKVIEYKYNHALVGSPVISMYRYNRYYVKNTKPLKARYAMFYINYTLNGMIYEEYSPISCTSTFLEGDNSHDIISGYDETGEGPVPVPVN